MEPVRQICPLPSLVLEKAQKMPQVAREGPLSYIEETLLKYISKTCQTT